MRAAPDYIPTDHIYRTPDRELASHMRKNSKVYATRERKAAASLTTNKAKAQRAAAAAVGRASGGLNSSVTAISGLSGSPKKPAVTVNSTVKTTNLLPPKLHKTANASKPPPPPPTSAVPSAFEQSPNRTKPTNLKDRTMTPMRATFTRTATIDTTAQSRGAGALGPQSPPQKDGPQPLRRALSAMRPTPAHMQPQQQGAARTAAKSPMRNAHAPQTQPQRASTGAPSAGSRPAVSPLQRRLHVDPSDMKPPRGFTTSSAGTSGHSQPLGTGETPLTHSLQPSRHTAAAATDEGWDMGKRMEELMDIKSTNLSALDRLAAHPETFTRSRSFTAGAAGHLRSSSQPAGSMSPHRERPLHPQPQLDSTQSTQNNTVNTSHADGEHSMGATMVLGQTNVPAVASAADHYPSDTPLSVEQPHRTMTAADTDSTPQRSPF
eukprot:GILI01018846.1.p1 GENE.GILI01018846.1~~GILI01018846.1.p1  ORF type:complete len:467 (+),score=73.03 GILI01018846.1:99-1403(+)